jgi:hypothetical protein
LINDRDKIIPFFSQFMGHFFFWGNVYERRSAGCFGENKQKGLVEGTLPSQRNRD